MSEAVQKPDRVSTR